MSRTKEKTPIDKKGFQNSFNYVGVVKLNNNTFQIDNTSSKSPWQYSRMNLAIDCGGKYGVCYANLMGGFSTDPSRQNVIYKFILGENGAKGQTTEIDWEDRFDESIVNEVPDYQTITVGIEKDNKGKTFYKKFLSEYDAIAYLNEHLADGMVVNVRGNLAYREYNGNVTVDRNLTSIALSNATEDNYRATFVQTVLVAPDALDKVDKEHMTIPVSAYVVEKLKEYNGWVLADSKNKGGQFVPLMRQWEYKFPDDQTKAKKAIDYLFKPKSRTVTMLTMDGVFENGGSVKEMTYNDLPDDIKELVAIGILTQEDALSSVAVNGPREHRMVFTKPHIKHVTGSDGATTSTVQIFKEKYTEDDLDLFFMHPHDTGENAMPEPEDTDEESDENESTDDNDSSWLDNL